MTSDRLAQLMVAAAGDRFPPADGGVTVLPPDRRTGLHAVLGFTAHAVVVTDRSADQVRAAGVDGFGGAQAPDTLRTLAGPHGWIGVLDAVLVAHGTGVGGTTLRRTTSLDDHPRVAHARQLRIDVDVLADERGLVALGRGLGGRTELGFEVAQGRRNDGNGRALLLDVLDEAPLDRAVFASCSPGNAQSLRCLLAAGFRPIGSEVLIRPTPPRAGRRTTRAG